jgi:CheY-like chemotaxis protein
MSVFVFLQAMTAAGRRAPVVMITAEDLPDRRARAAQLGAEAFVPKPFEARKLRELLHSIVLESSRGQALGAFA